MRRQLPLRPGTWPSTWEGMVDAVACCMGPFLRPLLRGRPSTVSSGRTAPESWGHGRSPSVRPASLVPFRVGLPRAHPGTPCLQTSTLEGLPETPVQGRSSAELEGAHPAPAARVAQVRVSMVPEGLRDQERGPGQAAAGGGAGDSGLRPLGSGPRVAGRGQAGVLPPGAPGPVPGRRLTVSDGALGAVRGSLSAQTWGLGTGWQGSEGGVVAPLQGAVPLPQQPPRPRRVS